MSGGAARLADGIRCQRVWLLWIWTGAVTLCDFVFVVPFFVAPLRDLLCWLVRPLFG